MRGALVAGLLMMLTGCTHEVPEPARVAVSPAAGPFSGSQTVTITASRDAVVYATTDGSDPRTASEGRLVGQTVLKVGLDRTATVRAFASVDAVDGPLVEATYTRSGSSPGTIAGVIDVSPALAGVALFVVRGSARVPAGKGPTGGGEVPFLLSGVSSGNFQLVAWGDVNADGLLTGVGDVSSAPEPVVIDLADPARAGAEGVRLGLGRSTPSRGTVRGTVTVPNPSGLESLQLSVLEPGQLEGLQASAFLELLQGGYRVFTRPGVTQYPYVITELEPGDRFVVTSLITTSLQGVAVNGVVPLRSTTVEAGGEAVVDADFGPVTISGRVTVEQPDGGPTSRWGMVAAYALNATNGTQFMTTPIVLLGGGGSFSIPNVRAQSDVVLKVFLDIDGSSPLTDALQWAGFDRAGTGDATLRTGGANVSVALQLRR